MTEKTGGNYESITRLTRSNCLIKSEVSDCQIINLFRSMFFLPFSEVYFNLDKLFLSLQK